MKPYIPVPGGMKKTILWDHKQEGEAGMVEHMKRKIAENSERTTGNIRRRIGTGAVRHWPNVHPLNGSLRGAWSSGGRGGLAESKASEKRQEISSSNRKASIPVRYSRWIRKPIKDPTWIKEKSQNLQPQHVPICLVRGWKNRIVKKKREYWSSVPAHKYGI